jgi:copper(I)-binding protein
VRSELRTRVNEDIMTRRRIFAAGSVALLLATTAVQTAAGQPAQIGDLSITQSWTRATPPRAHAAGGFVTIGNTGDTSDRLVAATSAIAGRVEIHEMRMDNGTMIMRPVDGGIEIPAGGETTLAPGGLHIMFMELKQGLVEGETIPVVLTFEQAGDVEVQFAVAAIGARAPGQSAADADQTKGSGMHDGGMHGHGQ